MKQTRSCFVGACLLPLLVSNGLASVDVCGQPAPGSYLSLAFSKQRASPIEPAVGEIDQENTRFDLQVRLRDDWTFGAGHRYTIVNVDPLRLQTNGHLHTYFLALHKERRSESGSVRFSIAPALSASSNIAKDPREYTAEALQVLAALVWNRRLSDRTRLWYGVCGDHRFGDYALYPSGGIEVRHGADWSIALGFPVSQLTYGISRNLASSLRIAPDGNEWYVEDERLEKRSRVVYDAWSLEWDLEWQVHDRIRVTAGVGRQLRNRYALTLLDDSRVRFRSDPATRFQAAVAWRF